MTCFLAGIFAGMVMVVIYALYPEWRMMQTFNERSFPW